ncbi:hypothetical protein KOW79_006825 [Hemibagrus wyckioides]|uniref:Uncharacterized protein n=1 Tax=Hemibagrus wyckioides TaxID=337641 RepID=A0A9D3ST95_9TELE|nr:hypothetical protein KOW79_006825 [Hemibagrus wyckioides]
MTLQAMAVKLHHELQAMVVQQGQALVVKQDIVLHAQRNGIPNLTRGYFVDPADMTLQAMVVKLHHELQAMVVQQGQALVVKQDIVFHAQRNGIPNLTR